MGAFSSFDLHLCAAAGADAYLQQAGERTTQLLGAAAEGAAADPAQVLRVEIECDAVVPLHPQPGDDEGFRLRLNPSGAHIHAPNRWGALHGLTALVQLCAGGRDVQGCEIEDAPRFAWRGLMLDPARRFLPVSVLRSTLDGMSLCRLNVLHLHLSDDQGFRFGSERFPQLVSDEHYSKGELRELVDYAAARGIRVIPELDVPGHCHSWLLGRPDWGLHAVQPSTRFGVHEACLSVHEPAVRAALFELFTELGEVFVDPCVHIGGDEVNPNWWSDCSAIDVAPDVLQAQFNRELRLHLAGLGRRLIGWDEILHDAFIGDAVAGAPDNAAVPRETGNGTIVQTWRGACALERAQHAGFDVVDSAGYYLDLMYPASYHYGYDPAAPQAQRLAREDALRADVRFAHVADGMRWTDQWRELPPLSPATHAGKVLGAEACLWGELVDARVLPLRLWSRLPAVAERLWSPVDVDDYPDHLARAQHLWPLLQVPKAEDHWRELGLAAAAFPFVRLLEPVKWYARLLGAQALQARLMGREMPQARPYRCDTPLRQLVDFLPPESPVAFELIDASAEHLLARLREWERAADAPLPADLEPLKQDLCDAAAHVRRFVSDDMGAAPAAERILALYQPRGEYVLALLPALVQWLQTQAGRVR